MTDPTGGFRNRTSLLLGGDALTVLAGKTVAIAGCGGVGGAAAILLARAGVGGFVLADPGRFDPPDANRQWGAFTSTLEENKARVYERMILEINPEARVTVLEEGVQEHTLAAVIEGCDFVVDCLDVSVPTALRMRMYREAQRAGVYCATAPIIGLGAAMMVEAPDGLGLEPLVQAFIDALRGAGRMPAGFARTYLPPHVERIERNLSRGVASVSIGPAVGGSMVATEVLCALLHGTAPEWRSPICLPQVVVAELGQPCFRVAHYRELFPGFFAEGAPARLPGAEGVAARRARLDGPGSLVALAPEHVTLDLLTDSHEAEISDGGPEAPESAVIAGLTELYPFPHIELAPRGRVAEAWLVDALIPPGSTVLVNALFPTAWHHLHGRGARLLRVDRAGELDLDRILAGLDEPGVAALWLELAPNASAGRPLPVELLEEVAAAARKRGVPLVLDACRLFTNAVALADAHASQMAAALCACGDACTAGLAKEVAAPLGGIVATRSAPLAERVRFVARRMYGHGLGPSARGRLLRALGDDPVVAVRTRADFTRRLHDTLLRLQVPVVGPPGGHAVWVEPTGLGYVATATRTAADALAEDLYLRAGIRAARNLGPPGEADLLRLAVRTDICTEDAFELVTSAFAGLKGR